MAGSNFGRAFQISTFGESHGPALGVIVQGCPPGLELTEEYIQKKMDQRKPGKGIGGTTRKEPDRPRLLSGVFEGKTTGTPIAILIENTDARSKSYADIAEVFRPGHGDYTYAQKYGIRDYRGGGRASARETAARVAAGAVAFQLLGTQGISIHSQTIALGGIMAQARDEKVVDTNEFRCLDSGAAEKMARRVREVKARGDSLGGVVEVIARNVPPGLGDPVFAKLDGELAKAMMGIGAVKAVEIGEGMGASRLTGFENNDALGPDGFETNHAGGILAGISNGEDIVIRVHVKPIPSISIPQSTVDLAGNSRQISTKGRHDICAIPRINPVCEAMAALVIADHYLRQRAIQ